MPSFGNHDERRQDEQLADDLVAPEHLGRAIATRASTVACQDGFPLVTFVFALALLPTRSIGWMDRRRRMV